MFILRNNLYVSGFETLEVLCPQRSVSKVHLLHPTESSKNNVRYYIVAHMMANEWGRTITVRSPLQVRLYSKYFIYHI